MSKYKVVMNNKIWSFTIESDTIQEEKVDNVKVTKFYEENDLVDFRLSKRIDYIKKIE
jgi:hypothetical protein